MLHATNKKKSHSLENICASTLPHTEGDGLVLVIYRGVQGYMGCASHDFTQITGNRTTFW